MTRRLYITASAILLVLLVLLSYSRSFDNQFVDWDDFTYVVNNDMVRERAGTGLKEIFTTPVSSNYHPLTILSLRLNNNNCETCPGGISPAPFIRTNIILHIMNTLLVFLFIFLLTKRNILISFLTAALFGVHPMHVESVAWISERKDLLYSFFFISGLITYILYTGTGKRFKRLLIGFTFLLFLLSCLSKAMAVVFPVVMILINFWMSDESDKKSPLIYLKNAFSARNIVLFAPFFLVSLFTGLLAYNIQNGNNFLGLLTPEKNLPDVVNEIVKLNLFQKTGVAAYGFITYIIRFFVPLNLSAIYPYPPVNELTTGSFSILLKVSPVVVILIFALVIWSLRKTRLWFFGTVFYFVTIVLVLQFISVGIAIMADRYTYLPYIGIAFILSSAAVNISGRLRYLTLTITGGFILVMMFLAMWQTEVWQNTETLWTRVIERYPNTVIPRSSRGKYYSKLVLDMKPGERRTSYIEKALADFRVAMKIGSKESEVYEGAGYLYGLKGDYETALQHLNIAIKLDKKKGSAYYNRAIVLAAMNRKEEAIRDYNSALLFRSEKAVEIITNRSNLFLDLGRYREAIPDFDFLISVDPGNFLFWFNRGLSKHATGDIAGAISDYRQALVINPGDEMTRNLLSKLTGPGR